MLRTYKMLEQECVVAVLEMFDKEALRLGAWRKDDIPIAKLHNNQH